jgi:hypothetical protein
MLSRMSEGRLEVLQEILGRELGWQWRTNTRLEVFVKGFSARSYTSDSPRGFQRSERLDYSTLHNIMALRWLHA